MSAMAKDRGAEILDGIQMVNGLKGGVKLSCSGMCKFVLVFLVLCLHCSICCCQDAFQSTVKASQEEKTSSDITPKMPLFKVDGERFKSMAQNNVERAKSVLGISDGKKNDPFSKPAYKAEDTKKILISLKNEFLSKHVLPDVLSTAESHSIKETPKLQAKESPERMETNLKYIVKKVNHVDHFDTKEIEPKTLEINNNVIEKPKFSSDDKKPIIDKSEVNSKDKFIHLISEEMRKDHPVSQEEKSTETYEPEKIKENNQAQYLRDFQKQEALMSEPITKEEKPTNSLHRENSELPVVDKAENYVKLDIFRKRGALTVMEKPLQSYIEDNYEKESAVIQEDSKLIMKSGESADKFIEEGERSEFEDRTMEEAGNSGRPAGTKIILERDVFNVIEERRETIINVTINPARVLTDKSKKFTSNWADSQSKVLNAKEFFTSLTVKNFTPVDKEQTNVFSSVIGKIVHDSVTAEKKSPISHIESSIAGKNATVNEDDTDQVQSDLKEKMAKDHILDVQEDGQILKEKHTEHHENVKPSAKGIVEEVDTEVKSDQPPEVKNEAYPKNVTDSEEVSEMRTGEVTETGKPVEKKIKHEKEPTNTTKMDAKPGEATEEKIKMVQTASGVSSESVKPEDKLEKVNKKIPDTEKSNEKDKDSMGKLPEPEKPQDMLETYSQFTQRVNAEKKNDVASNGHGGNGHGKGPKVKSKNYASPDCGSKLMLANPEASHSSKVIQSNKDEYMLNKCRDKIWFIIELCESIRPQKFDIANFELFSNLPKDIQVSGSHRYPTRDWTNLSRTVGQEGNRGVQSFPIDTEDFFKYIKVEVLSHYGSEFFCPLSLFRIYGLSEFEVIDTIEDSTDHDESEEAFGDPFEEEEAVDKFKDEGKPSVIPTVLKNMFSGVLDVIKRGYRPHSSASEPGDHCYSLHPKFAVDKSRCSMAESLNYILSCYWTEYEALMQKPVVSSTVKNSSFCRQLASTMCLEPGVNDSIVYDTVCNSSYVCVMLSPKHILAMCYMHDNRIMDAAVECDSSSTHMSENFSATSSDIIPSSDEIPSYVKNAKINTSRITRADALDSNASGTFDVQGTRLARDLESGQVLVEQEFHKANESIVPASTSESSTSETSKPPKKSKSNSSGHKGKSIKEVDQKDDITEPEEKLEADISSFGGIELEEVEFQQGEELTTPQPAPVAQPPAESKVSSTSPTNKESVVVRLSNKIKALEYNMSISSQYLEELSRRYKRQMEEMQKQFNLTIAALNATSWQAYQRDQQHQKDIETLENQLATVGNILKKLVDEQANLAHTVVEQHLLLMVVEVFVLCVVFFLCSRRSSRHMQQINTLKQKRREQVSSNANLFLLN